MSIDVDVWLRRPDRIREALEQVDPGWEGTDDEFVLEGDSWQIIVLPGEPDDEPSEPDPELADHLVGDEQVIFVTLEGDFGAGGDSLNATVKTLVRFCHGAALHPDSGLPIGAK